MHSGSSVVSHQISLTHHLFIFWLHFSPEAINSLAATPKINLRSQHLPKVITRLLD